MDLVLVIKMLVSLQYLTVRDVNFLPNFKQEFFLIRMTNINSHILYLNYKDNEEYLSLTLLQSGQC